MSDLLFDRLKVSLMGKLTLANIRFKSNEAEVDVKRSEKDFVSKLKDDFSNSSSIIVAQYSATVSESESLRKEMRDNGAKFKVTKNRLTKLAIAETQFKEMSDLFKGPTALLTQLIQLHLQKLRLILKKNLIILK